VDRRGGAGAPGTRRLHPGAVNPTSTEGFSRSDGHHRHRRIEAGGRTMSQVEFDEDIAAKIEALYRIGGAVRRRRIVRGARRAPGRAHPRRRLRARLLLRRAGSGGGAVRVGGRRRLEPGDARARRPPLRRARRRRASPGRRRLAARRRRQLRRRAVRAGARVRPRPDRLPGRDPPGPSTGRAGGVGHRLGDGLLRAGLRPRRTCAAPGTSTHPPLPATHTRPGCAAGFDEIRMEAHSFSTCELDPRPTRGPAPFMGTFAVGRNGITDEQAQAWVSEQQQLGQRAEFYREHPALLQGDEAALLSLALRRPIRNCASAAAPAAGGSIQPIRASGSCARVARLSSGIAPRLGTAPGNGSAPEAPVVQVPCCWRGQPHQCGDRLAVFPWLFTGPHRDGRRLRP
jgi:hypothetical protein